ncbi:Fic family protein [Streptomyces sp. NPDC092370]|uniref:Fic family protein n=1 Tax=Streptomyces sp. NPDC092370 TaxID=3366016 RepID=UPI00382BD316
MTRYLTVDEVTAIAEVAFGGGRPRRVLPDCSPPPRTARARMFGTAAYDDLYEQAAALLHALAANPPLVDGNKRTAWPATATFLALNGVDPAGLDQDAAYALVVDVASGAEAEVGWIAGRLRGL